MSRLSGTTILLVEDDLDNLELLVMCLEAEGAHVLGASSLAGGLAISVGQRPDILVTDLELPDGDGYALLQQLRGREGLGRLPAVAVSGYLQGHWRSEAATSGFDHYAVKPFAIDSLVLALVSLRGGGRGDENASL